MLVGGALPAARGFLCDLPFHHSSQQPSSAGDEDFALVLVLAEAVSPCPLLPKPHGYFTAVGNPHAQAPASQQPFVFPFPPQEGRPSAQI